MRAIFLLSASALAVVAACTPDETSGGTGGACPMGPQAMFDLTITAAKGPVPPSTTVDVSWSAGAEPTFALDHADTWKTIEQANIICDVDPMKPPPHDLPALVCHMWTTGPIKVVVRAKGYTPFEQTYASTYSDHCHALVPMAIRAELAREPEMDGGAM